MADIWSFLLQTLTASGVAALLLLVKAMFRDKLPPRWQFAVWSILGVVVLLPAGLFGRYTLLNWPFYVELFRSNLTGEYGALAHVSAPIPLPPDSLPRTAAGWLFLLYLAGVVVLLARYGAFYIRLRLALSRGRPAEDGPIRAVGEKYGLPVCPAVEVEGLPSAFICGVFRPVLALPAGAEPEEKIILHELLHLKYRDAAWGILICLLRCLHWCNPLLWYCANLAGNDLESLCDQRVLERLEGEDRRDYGRILLAMAGEGYARAPGTSSMANGGKNIRRRVEAIARFKRYPAGMGLVSVCLILVLAAPVLAGAQAPVENHGLAGYAAADLAYARTVPCTTYAGALDVYAKAVLAQRSDYRAMCAPLSEQNALAESYTTRPIWLWEDMGLNDGKLSHPNVSSGYRIYNLDQVGKETYEGTLVLELGFPPNEATKGDYICLAAQPLRVWKEGNRWVATPLDQFQAFQAQGWTSMPTSCGELPAWEFEAQGEDFLVRLRRQSISWLDSYAQDPAWFGNAPFYDLSPQPNASFTTGFYSNLEAVYTGGPAKKGTYTNLGFSSLPFYEGEERPQLQAPDLPSRAAYSAGSFEEVNFSGGGNSGGSQGNVVLREGWESPVFLSGGGGTGSDPLDRPSGYALDLYHSGQKEELTLLPVNGGGLSD